MKWSFLMPNKNQITRMIEPLLEVMKQKVREGKYMRCDNSWEHLGVYQKLSNKYNFEIEITAPYTPQKHGVVERVFVTLSNRAVADMIDAKVTQECQETLWTELVHTQTTLCNNMVTVGRVTTPQEWFVGTVDHPLLNQLQILGRAALITDRRLKQKLFPKGFKCMYLGHPMEKHSLDTYRFWNPITKSVVLSRDVKWLEYHGGVTPTGKFHRESQHRR